jgi:hypothetical protein
VIVVAGGGEIQEELDEDALRVRAGELLAAGKSARDVARILVAEHGLSRNDAYRLAQEAAPAAMTGETVGEEAASESE